MWFEDCYFRSLTIVFGYLLMVLIGYYFVSVWRQRVDLPIQPICLEMKMSSHFQTSFQRPKSALWVVSLQIIVTLFKVATVGWSCFNFFLSSTVKKTSALAESRHFRRREAGRSPFAATFVVFCPSQNEWWLINVTVTEQCFIGKTFLVIVHRHVLQIAPNLKYFQNQP